MRMTPRVSNNAWWPSLKDYTCGHLTLTRTLALGFMITIALACGLTVLVEGLEVDRFRYGVRQGVAVTRLVLLMSALVWWGLCVMRVCVYRTGQGKSVLFSGVVFLTALYGVSQAVAELGGDAKVIAQNWHASATNGWYPLEVWADPVLGRIVAKGDITHDSDRLFAQVVYANPGIKVVQIESFGGHVDEALAMAKLIRTLGLDTVSFRRCASACTLMFVAGRNRYLGPDAQFGFHRAGYAGMPSHETLEETDQKLAAFYKAMGAGPEIGLGELATPHHRLWKPTQSELFVANYATLRWSERPPGM